MQRGARSWFNKKRRWDQRELDKAARTRRRYNCQSRDSRGQRGNRTRDLKPLMNLSPPLYRGTSVQPSPSCFFVTCRPSTVFSSGSITAFTSVRKILNKGFNTSGDYLFYRRVYIEQIFGRILTSKLPYSRSTQANPPAPFPSI